MHLALLSDISGPTPMPGGHGLGSAVHSVATMLHQRGHDVTLFASEGSRFDGKLVMPCKFGLGYGNEVTLAKAAYQFHKEQPFDVFFDHGHTHVLSSTFPGLPVVNMYHDIWQPESRCAVLCSEGQRALMPQWAWTAEVIHHAIDPTPFPLREKAETPRYALYLGIVRDYKQPILAIEACAALGLKLVIAGVLPPGVEAIFSQGTNCQYIGPVVGQYKSLLIQGATCLLQLGTHESFGLTTVESGLCFPYNTQIRAANVLRGIESQYTGKMIRIKTANGEIEATAEHPIWTNAGWKKARDIVIGDKMLYTLNGCNEKYANAKQIQKVYIGTIGSIVSRLRNNAIEGGGGTTRHDRSSSPLATPSSRSIKVAQFGTFFDHYNSIGTRTGIYSGDYRWGGHDLNQTNAPRKGKTLNQYRQYILCSDGVVEAKNTAKICIYRQKEEAETGLSERIRFSDRRIDSSSSIQSVTALYGHQEKASRIDDRMDGNETKSDEANALYRETDFYHATYPGSEYQSVTQIETRYVTDLPVYNLTTESGTYSAEGFLVHNCGTPIVAWPSGGALDLVKHGVNGLFVPSSRNRAQAVADTISQIGSLDRAKVREYTLQFTNGEKQAHEIERVLVRCAGGDRW